MCSAVIEVLLLFSEEHQLHDPPLPLIFYSLRGANMMGCSLELVLKSHLCD